MSKGAGAEGVRNVCGGGFAAWWARCWKHTLPSPGNWGPSEEKGRDKSCPGSGNLKFPLLDHLQSWDQQDLSGTNRPHGHLQLVCINSSTSWELYSVSLWHLIFLFHIWFYMHLNSWLTQVSGGLFVVVSFWLSLYSPPHDSLASAFEVFVLRGMLKSNMWAYFLPIK